MKREGKLGNGATIKMMRMFQQHFYPSFTYASSNSKSTIYVGKWLKPVASELARKEETLN